jgi:hypothetical protein
MATRLYLSARTDSRTPAADGSWEKATGFVRRTALTEPQGNAFANISIAAQGTSGNDTLLAQFISRPLSGAQSISGTFKGQMRFNETSTALDGRAQIVVRVLQSDMSTVRGTLYAGDTAALANEFSTVLTNRRNPRTAGSALSTVNAEDGDVIVIEVGGRQHAASGASMVAQYGDAVASDLPEDESSTSTINPWVEFSGTLTFQDDAVARVSQVDTEVLFNPAETITARVSQVALEVLYRETGGHYTADATLEAVQSGTFTGDSIITERAPPYYVSQSSNGFTTGSPVVVNYAAAGLVGDLFILHMRWPTSNTLNIPAGWAALSAERNSDGMKSRLLYKFADGSEPASVSVSISGGVGGTRTGKMYRFGGLDTTTATPWENYAIESATAATTMNDTGVTASGSGRLAVNMSVSNVNSTIPEFTGETGGDWVRRADAGAGTPAHRHTMHTAGLGMAGTIDGGSSSITSTIYHNHGIALIGRLQSITFTADAVLLKTQTGSFTADSFITTTSTATFTANATFVIKLFEDNFNRSVTDGLGTPSGPGTYPSFLTGTGYDQDVNGTQLITSTTNTTTATYSPSTTVGLVYFDYWVGADADAGQNYVVVLDAEGPDTGGDYSDNNIFVSSNGFDGEWTITAGNASYTFTPTVSTMYRAKVWLGSLLSGTDFTRVKTWIVGDPEPDWQDEFAVQSSALASESVIVVNAASEEGRVDNLTIWRSGVTTTKKFTADAFFTTIGVGVVSRVFTADAFLLKSNEYTFTADAALSFLVSATFTADAYLYAINNYTFTAKALLVRPALAAEYQVSRMRKTVTFQVSRNRQRPLGNYLPPTPPTEDDEEDTTITGPCLPPCIGSPTGPGTVWGVNGYAIRRTIVYCTSCGGNFYWTPDNFLGTDSGTTSGHDCCGSSHSKGLHVQRIWVQYTNIPTQKFQMRSKLKWNAAAAKTNLTVRVYANINGLPNILPGSCEAHTPTLESTMWDAGEYIGDLAFGKTGSDSNYWWDDTSASLIISPSQLNTNTFRFELTNETDVIKATFKAGNMEVL